jgi:hypothetical protein
MSSDAASSAADQQNARKLVSPLDKKDIFDSDDFDAIRLINQVYPDGAMG